MEKSKQINKILPTKEFVSSNNYCKHSTNNSNGVAFVKIAKQMFLIVAFNQVTNSLFGFNAPGLYAGIGSTSIKIRSSVDTK